MNSGSGRLQVTERLGSGDSVNPQMPRGLIPHDGTFGEGTVAPVDWTGREPGTRQFALQLADRLGPSSAVSLAGIQDRLGRRKRAQRERAGYAVDSKPVSSLEGDHRVLGQRSVPSVDGAR
jgi:hypothetical protein